MDFDSFLNQDKLKDIIELISTNKKLSDKLILNTIKENYNSEEYWKYVIEKVHLSNDFILENIEHLNLDYILKYQKIDSDIISNNKFIKHIIDRDYVNTLVRYQTISFQTLDYLILNGYVDSEFWNIISQYQILTNEYIRKYDDKLNWKLISTYQNIDLDLITDYLDKIDLNNIPLNISSSSLINSNTITLFEKYPIWDNIACLNNLSNDTVFNSFEKLSHNSIINILSYRELDDKFIMKIIEKFNDPEIWKLISMNQTVTTSFIDKYIDKLDWKEFSENHNFSYCSSVLKADANPETDKQSFPKHELSKYNMYIDYKYLSYNDNFTSDWLDILIDNKITNINVKNLDLHFLSEYDILSSDDINRL